MFFRVTLFVNCCLVLLIFGSTLRAAPPAKTPSAAPAKGADRKSPASNTPVTKTAVEKQAIPAKSHVVNPVPPPGRVEFTRIVAHWTDYAKPEYLKFLEDAQPDIAQVGFYGGHYWSLSHTKDGAGYPSHFPMLGLKECGDFFQNLNAEIHRRNIKVVGHIDVTLLVGNPSGPQGPEGFFKFYKDLWDEKELGPRPVANPLDLLEKHADGSPNFDPDFKIGKMIGYWACLSNPHWRTVLKAWTKRGIERGLDGYMINYFYRHDCLCPHCQSKFRGYLRQRFTPAELKEKFDIADLEHHKFTEIVAWHKPEQSTPLRRVMLQFSQTTTKEAFDEVFIDYGRKLKPDLIVGQWNHLGDFHQISGDERSLLPGPLWGRGEDYLWYSTGGAAFFTDLANGFLGDGTLQARYIRGAFDDKPFTLGKYESTRIRASIAELAANGGAPMGFYTNFTDPVARDVIVRYYRFIKRYDELYRANRPVSEVLLVYPRSLIHAGDIDALNDFRRLGRKLLDQHVLFDVKPDDLVNPADSQTYALIVRAPFPKEVEVPTGKVSTFDAPQTVRIAASRRARDDSELDIHFVNYNREEPKGDKAGKGIVDEKPIAAKGVAANVRIPAGFCVTRVEAICPEGTSPESLKFLVTGDRVKFAMPEFLVYGVARIRLEPAAK